MKNPLLALILATMLSCTPLISTAQEVIDSSTAVSTDTAVPAETAPTTTPDPVLETTTPETPNIDVAPVPDTSNDVIVTDVQDATTTQNVVTADVLEATADPQATTTTEIATVVQNDATTTEQSVIDVVPDQHTSQDDTTPIDPQPQLDVVAQALTVEPEATSTASTFQRDVDPDFVIALSGKTIPTERKDGKGKTMQTIRADTNASVDVSTGDVHLSGSCSNTYFVVLLFKNQTDYDTDPRSYILNKAFPCENGQYSYAVSDLPPTLQNGVYYLLVGEQGDTGSWKPITSLTEITINKQ